MKVSLTLVSANRKTGPISTSMSSSETCPSSCPFIKAGCYAKGGMVRMHWKRLDESLDALSWDAFCNSLKRIYRGSMFRHNIAGDLPSNDGDNETVNHAMLAQLVKAAAHLKAFCYTHKTNRVENYPAIKAANDAGFTINLSANNPAHADKLAALGIGPVATVLPSTVDGNQIRTMATPEGRKIVICPATYKENVTCQTCRLCSRGDRTCIIGFPSHGTSFKKVDAIASRVHDHSMEAVPA